MGNGIYCKGAENFEDKKPKDSSSSSAALKRSYPSAVLRRVEILLSVQVKQNVVTK